MGREYPNSELRKLIDFIFGKEHCKKLSENDGAKEIIK
jgi:hypothetical protein